MNKIPSGRKLLRGGTRHRTYNRGFSLVEILVVVLIMGILVGVVGSLLGGFITTFEITDDQSIARRRAADVFNILQNPMLYAGMGIPADTFGYYFRPTTSLADIAPISSWPGPVSVNPAGDVLRVVYTVPAGVKHGVERVTDFSGDTEGFANVSLQVSSLDVIEALSEQGEIRQSVYNDIRSYVTFPGIRMHPVAIKDIKTGSDPIEVVGRTSPRQTSGDVFPRNVILPYHDMYLVRAGVAYVDSENSRFYFAEITDDNVTPSSPAPNNLNGFRVEGIKAIHFEPVSRDVGLSSGNKHITGIRVYVIAEGDNYITGRNTGTASSASQAFRSEPRWTHLNDPLNPNRFRDEVYYEEFQMQWRTRNVEAPEA